MRDFELALIQLTVTDDKPANLKSAGRLLEEAAARGANVAVLPEMFNCPYQNDYFVKFAEEANGETQGFLAETAARLNMVVIGGSMPEREGSKIYNSCFVYGADGGLLGRHRKVHLFDIDVPGGAYFKESDTFTAGNDITVVKTPYGSIGVAICFDIRFAELARLMALEPDTALLVYPAAFNMTTGPAHWELLLRIRAMDNQLFVAGASPARNPNANYLAYGHSLVADPWGEVLCELDEKEGVLLQHIDVGRIERVRQRIALLNGRREDVYTLIAIKK